MNPTKNQIKEALARIDRYEKGTYTDAVKMAAAYRARDAECEMLKRQYDEAIGTNQLRGDLYLPMIERHKKEREAL